MHAKPQPLYSPPVRKLCPVCGMASYSAAGVHPQCAAERADVERMKSAQPAAAAADNSPDGGDLSPWQTRCPKCRAVVHVRKKTCVCGHLLQAEREADD